MENSGSSSVFTEENGEEEEEKEGDDDVEPVGMVLENDDEEEEEVFWRLIVVSYVPLKYSMFSANMTKLEETISPNSRDFKFGRFLEAAGCRIFSIMSKGFLDL